MMPAIMALFFVTRYFIKQNINAMPKIIVQIIFITFLIFIFSFHNPNFFINSSLLKGMIASISCPVPR